MPRVVRPRSIALVGIACLAVSVVLGLLHIVEPVAWAFAITAVVALVGAFGYFAVSLIESGHTITGLLIVWVPAAASTIATNPAISVPEMIIATLIEVVLLIGAMMLVLRIGRWASVRYSLPYPI
jgi:hypothetical protein